MPESSAVEHADRPDLDRAVTRREVIDRWTEILLAVMLGAVALATAWSGYQSARWGGVQSVLFSKAGALRTESTRASTQAGQLVMVDIGLYSNWINAYAEGNEDLAAFYVQRFREEFRPAFDAWLDTDPANNPNAPSSPFDMPEYRLSKLLESQQLEREAEATFQEGLDANQQSDDYVLNAVILASVLFLAGIATRFDWLPVRIAVVVAAGVLLAIGLYNIIVYPVS